MISPIISIVIATFNSQETLPKVLASIYKQTFSKDKLEIIVVDGGSSDKTTEIAKRFNCKILKNPKVIPFAAKCIGTSKARGRYIVYLDADEVLLNSKSLLLKNEVFRYDKRIKAVIGSGYKNPRKSSIVRSYINEFGDPFSFFVYRLSKNSKYFLKQMLKKYPLFKDNKNFVVFDFSSEKQLPIIELGAAGSMIDLDYIRKRFPKFDYETFAHLFYLINKDKTLIGITKDDFLRHYSSDNLRKYLNKIKWRVKNNIYHQSEIGTVGFIGRDEYQARFFRLKKYLFIPYSYSIIFPLLDSAYLAMTRKNLGYLLHLPLTVYTATLILLHYFLKILGAKPKLKSYDESKIVDR